MKIGVKLTYMLQVVFQVVACALAICVMASEAKDVARNIAETEQRRARSSASQDVEKNRDLKEILQYKGADVPESSLSSKDLATTGAIMRQENEAADIVNRGLIRRKEFQMNPGDPLFKTTNNVQAVPKIQVDWLTGKYEGCSGGGGEEIIAKEKVICSEFRNVTNPECKVTQDIEVDSSYKYQCSRKLGVEKHKCTKSLEVKLLEHSHSYQEFRLRTIGSANRVTRQYETELLSSGSSIFTIDSHKKLIAFKSRPVEVRLLQICVRNDLSDKSNFMLYAWTTLLNCGLSFQEGNQIRKVFCKLHSDSGSIGWKMGTSQEVLTLVPWLKYYRNTKLDKYQNVLEFCYEAAMHEALDVTPYVIDGPQNIKFSWPSMPHLGEIKLKFGVRFIDYIEEDIWHEKCTLYGGGEG